MQSESIKNLAAALIAVQMELPPVTKDRENPYFHSKYVGLDTVMPAALKVLTAHGLGVVQSVGGDGNGGTTLTTMLLHESGEWLSDTQPLLLVKPDPQGQGSAITYGRRYAIMAMLGLVADDDDDGAAASPPVDRRQEYNEYHEQNAAPRQSAPIQGNFKGPKLMASKFGGKCFSCGGNFPAGQDIFYDGTRKVAYHVECFEVPPPEPED